MIKDITVLLVIVLIVVASLFGLEKNDISASNRYYHHIKENAECLEYLRTVNQIPTWRLSLITALIVTFFNSFMISFVIKNKKLSSTESFWLVVGFMIMVNFIAIYKLLGHWNWHYMCDW